MIDIKILREHTEEVRQAVKNRRMDIDLDAILKIDGERRKLQKQADDKRALKNKAGEKIAKASSAEKKKLISEMKDFDKEQDKLERKLSAAEEKFNKLFSFIPNIPLKDVPVGPDESGNVILREVGKPNKFTFEPKDAAELGAKLDIIDTVRAAKVSGTRFGYLKGKGALLEFALVRYAMDNLLKEGFVPVIPPVLVREEIMWAMGFLDRHGDEIYSLPEDKLRLVGTSEQSVVPMHKDEILSSDELPKKYLGFSSCFRRESGSYGKDTRGIIRVHQFDKLEMVAFVRPEDGEKEHEKLLAIQEKLQKELGLPYKVVLLCTGDIGTSSARTYDIETWLPSEKKYRETHSTSTTTDFQARRLNIRVKDKATNKLEYAYILNGTVFAVGRMITAILENGQNEDGSVTIPEVLVPYCGFETIGAK